MKTTRRRAGLAVAVALSVGCGSAEGPRGESGEPAPPQAAVRSSGARAAIEGPELANLALPAPGPYHVAALGNGELVASRPGKTLLYTAERRLRRELGFGGHVAADAAGNVFLAGDFQGSVSIGGHSLSSAGGLDAWIAKLDANLELVWVSQLGSVAADRPRELCADGSGGAIVMGNGIGTRALDANGAIRWSSAVAGSDLALHDGGALRIVGGFIDELDFGEDSYYADQPAVFVAELASDGSTRSSRVFSGTGPVHAERIAIDASGGYVIVGAFRGSVAFGGELLAWQGEEGEPYLRGYAAAFDARGRHRWSASTEIANPFEIIGDAHGNVIVTGNPSDSEAVLDLLWLDPSGAELPHDFDGGAGYGFDLALTPKGSLHWSFEAYSDDAPVLEPYVSELALD